jgi:hypothetical protein
LKGTESTAIVSLPCTISSNELLRRVEQLKGMRTAAQ